MMNEDRETTTKGGQATCSEWYAMGFDPDCDTELNDFDIAMQEKQVPKIESRRLHNGTQTLMRGVSSITTKPAKPKKSFSTFREHRMVELEKNRLMKSWFAILQDGGNSRFRIVGLKVEVYEATVWIYNSETETLFMLRFESKHGDDWLKDPVYHFHDSNDHDSDNK